MVVKVEEVDIKGALTGQLQISTLSSWQPKWQAIQSLIKWLDLKTHIGEKSTLSQ